MCMAVSAPEKPMCRNIMVVYEILFSEHRTIPYIGLINDTLIHKTRKHLFPEHRTRQYL